MSDIKPDGLYTVRELCKLLKQRNLPCHYNTVRQWVTAGKVEAVRSPGGRIRILGREVLKVCQWKSVA